MAMTADSWIEISRSLILHNYGIFLKLAAGRDLLPIVKANAYGHGLEEVAEILSEAGQIWFGVHSAAEAQRLATVAGKKKILILSRTRKEDLAELLPLGARFTVVDQEGLEETEAEGKKIGQPIPIHLKLETGVHRQGFMPSDLAKLAETVRESLYLDPEGAHGHFANIEDSTDHSYALQQMEQFRRALEELESRGVRVRMKHHSCSAAGILFPETAFDLLRVGISLYGHWPSRETLASARALERNDLDLKPALSWKTRLHQVKEVPAGSHVGYGCTWKAGKKTRIGILPIGYSDGYDRGLDRAWVLVRGQRAPLRGRVMMNLCVVDLSEIPEARRDDEVVLIGSQGEETLGAETLAGLIGTINYELLARLASHLPRWVVD